MKATTKGIIRDVCVVLSLSLVMGASSVAAQAPKEVLACEKALDVQARGFWKKVWNCLTAGGDSEQGCIADARSESVQRLSRLCSDAVAQEALGEASGQVAVDRTLSEVQDDATGIFNRRFVEVGGTGEGGHLAQTGANPASSSSATFKAGKLDVRLYQSTRKALDICEAQNRKQLFTAKGNMCDAAKTENKLSAAVTRYQERLAKLPRQPSLAGHLETRLPFLIANPTCQQDLALRGYTVLDRMLWQVEGLIEASARTTLTAGQIVDSAISVAGDVSTLSGIRGASIEDIFDADLSKANQLLTLSFGDDAAIGQLYFDLLVNCGARLGDETSCYEFLFSQSLSALVNWHTAYTVHDLTLRLNEVMLATEYLKLYYQYGGDSSLVAQAQGLPADSTRDGVIASFKYDPAHWYDWLTLFSTGDYDATRVGPLIDQGEAIVASIVANNRAIACQSGTLSAPWPMFGHDAQHTGASPFVGPQTNNVRWIASANPRLCAAVRGSAVIGGNGSVYFTSEDGYLNAVKADAGTWRVSLGDSSYCCGLGVVSTAPAVSSDGTIYAIFADRIQALNPDGSIKWSLPTGQLAGYGPIMGSDGTLYLVAGNGAGSCTVAVRDTGTAGNLLWQTCGSFTRGLALSSDDTVVVVQGPWVGLYTHYDVGTGIAVLDPNSGSELRTAGSGGPFTMAPAVDSMGNVYAGGGLVDFGYDYGAYLSAKADGSTNWNTGDLAAWETSGGRDRVSALGQGQTFFVASNSLVSRALSDGRLLWSFPLQPPPVYPAAPSEGGASPSVDSQGNVYVGSSTGIFYALNPDGTEKWHYQTGGAINTQPAIGADGTLYVGSDDGNVYAFGSGTGLPPPPTPAIDGYTRIPCGLYDLQQFGYQADNALGSFSDGSGGDGRVRSVGQIIHPQFSGTSTAVSFYIERYGSPVWSAQLSIYSYSGSTSDPAGTLLAQSDPISATEFPTGELQLVPIALNAPVTINAGNWYYLEMTTDSETFSSVDYLYFDTSYAGGSGGSYGGYDPAGEAAATEIVGLEGISGLDGYSCAHTPPPAISLFPTMCGPSSDQSYDLLFDLGGLRQ